MQPFKFGQKVVCIEKAIGPDGMTINKGDVFVVRSLWQCPKCFEWLVDIGFTIYGNGVAGHGKCGVVDRNSKAIYAPSKKFAPIEQVPERIKYIAVSETLREQAVEVAAIETN